MEDSIEIIEVEWTAEELDNGIVLGDANALTKEAAVEGSGPYRQENIKRMLGEWFFAELSNAFKSLKTPLVRIKMKIESDIWEFIPPQLASVVFFITASATDAASRRPFIIKAPWVPLPLLAMRSSPLFRYLNLWSAKSGTR